MQPATDAAGNAITGATVAITDSVGAAAAWYSASSGGTSSTASLTTTRGQVTESAWLEAGAYTIRTSWGSQVDSVSVDTSLIAGTPLEEPGSLGAAHTLTLTAADKRLVGTLSADHVLTVSGLVAGYAAELLLFQDSSGAHTFSILVNGITTQHAVNTDAGSPTAFKLVATSTTDYALIPLGA